MVGVGEGVGREGGVTRASPRHNPATRVTTDG
jgi:hypothetical protein